MINNSEIQKEIIENEGFKIRMDDTSGGDCLSHAEAFFTYCSDLCL